MSENKTRVVSDILSRYLNRHRKYFRLHNEDPNMLNASKSFFMMKNFPVPSEYFFHEKAGRPFLTIVAYIGIIYPDNETSTIKKVCELRSDFIVDKMRIHVRPEIFNDAGIRVNYEIEVGKEKATDEAFDHLFSKIESNLYNLYHELNCVATEGYRDEDSSMNEYKGNVQYIAKYIETRMMDDLVDQVNLYGKLFKDRSLISKIGLLKEDEMMKKRISLFTAEALADGHNIKEFYDMADNDWVMFRIMGMVISCLEIKNKNLVFHENKELKEYLETGVWDELYEESIKPVKYEEIIH